MEYRSRLKRRKRKNTGGGGRAVLAVLMIAGLVYLAASSKAGDWVAQNVMAPIFTAFERAPDGDEPSAVQAGDGEAEAVAVSLSGGLSSDTVTVTLPSVNCYMLQMGVYSVESNADSQAETLKAAGAGGFVLNDSGQYRVLAAGYPDEGSAATVKARLISEGMDTTVYSISTPSATFRVTAAKEEVGAVASAFTALYSAHGALTELAMGFDAADADVDKASASIKSIYDALIADTAILDEYSGKSEAFARIALCRDAFSSAMSGLIDKTGQSVVDFSSGLKYTQLYITNEYVGLMSSFA